MARLCNNLVIWGILLLVGLTRGQDSTKTNLQLLQDQMVQPVVRALDSLNLPPQAIAIQVTGEDELSAWIEQKLKEEVLSKGWNLYLADSSFTKDDGVMVQISGANVEIQYRSKEKNWLFRTTRYLRQVEGVFSYQIVRAGEILAVKEKHFRYRDEVPAGELKHLENPLLPFSRGTRYSSPWIDRFLEPVVITAATLTVVYLFYTLRSSAR